MACTNHGRDLRLTPGGVVCSVCGEPVGDMLADEATMEQVRRELDDADMAVAERWLAPFADGKRRPTVADALAWVREMRAETSAAKEQAQALRDRVESLELLLATSRALACEAIDRLTKENR